MPRKKRDSAIKPCDENLGNLAFFVFAFQNYERKLKDVGPESQREGEAGTNNWS